MTAIHRRLFSRFFLREGGRLYTGYQSRYSANLFGEKDLQWSYPGCLLPVFENTQKNFMLNLVLVLILGSKGLYCSYKQDTKER